MPANNTKGKSSLGIALPREFVPFNIPIFPFLLAIYPIIALRNFNIEYVNFSSILRSLSVSLLVLMLGYVILRLVLKDWYKAGLISALGLILFFSYGHIYLFFEERWSELFRHRHLLSLFGVIFIFGSWWVLKKAKDFIKPTRFLNVVSLTLILLSFWQSAAHNYATYRVSVDAERNNEMLIQAGLNEQPQNLPDIYYIILDGYTRSDVLIEDYEYDNSEFIEELSSLGFYVAECSQSNYPSTIYSLTSALNLNYLQDIYEDIKLLPPWKSSIVNQTLEILGYTIIRFENSVEGHFDLEEDILLSRKPLVLENVSLFGGLNEFEMMLMESSLFQLLVTSPELLRGFLGTKIADSGSYEHYLQTHFILDELRKLPDRNGPKFVFAHLLVPHSPYIFTSDGEYKYRNDENVGYLGYRTNVEFLDNHIPSVLQTIIESSEIPPIIILQGDHGPTGALSPASRMKILNAYYISEAAQESLYSTITPVNSFRIIFNHYFGSEYELLEDKGYHFYPSNTEITEDDIIPNNCDLTN